MQESKNDYSHLKVIATNRYAHLLYGQDVEDLHRGNSRELMLRYVKLMNFSKYLLLALAFVIYAIGAFDLGFILPASFIEYMIVNFPSVEALDHSIESVGGDKKDLSNIMLILYFIVIPCFFLGIGLFYFEIRFLMIFDFFPIAKKININNFWMIISFIGCAFIMYLYIDMIFTSVGGGKSSRYALIFAPVQWVSGYTSYVLGVFFVIWLLPSILTSTYAVILRMKEENK